MNSLSDYHKCELNPDQKRRYSRNILMPEIGREGQLRLLNSNVLIVGAGALGSIAAMYLAASGVGQITLVDFDTIDISNLQRQLSFTTAQCGQKKAEATRRRLESINPDIRIEIFDGMLTRKNAQELFQGKDLVIEGSDNPATKYLVTDLCADMSIPYVLGGVAQFRGQVMSWKPGCPKYSDIFPEPAEDGAYTPCAIGGVLGPLPGIIGSYQAAEAIKMLTDAGTPLYGRLLIIDALTATTQTINL